MSLEYWNSLANQVILISALLSGFSIAIVANVIVSDNKNKYANRILKTATIAAGSFLVSVFAMTKIALLTTPGAYLKHITENDFMMPRIIGIITFMIGLFALSALIGYSGWIKSKKIGIFTTIVGVVTLILILLTMIKINFN